MLTRTLSGRESGNEIRWHLRDFEPTRADNIAVKVYPAKTWRSILALRSNAAQHPGDAGAWEQLGDGYLSLGISNHMMDSTNYYVSNGHFADLAIQAYQKALALRPNWGDPHFKIGEILLVQKMHAGGSPYGLPQAGFRMEDPAIRRGLEELHTAWSFGILDSGAANAFTQYLNGFYLPDLDLRARPFPPITITPFPTQAAGATTPAKGITDEHGVNMLLVSAGQFTMGRDDSGYPDQRPAHKVSLDAYYMDQYEVTIQAYKVCVAAGVCALSTSSDSSLLTKYNDPGFGSYPMQESWETARMYCAWRGNGTRLPTEAEWEKAARGPSTGSGDGRVYPWGAKEEIPGLVAVNALKANYGHNFSGDALPVGVFDDDKSIYGIHDMAGNVVEWVNDWYSKDYYAVSPSSNPTGFNLGQERVYRGGSAAASIDISTTTYRGHVAPNALLGFRCARPLPGTDSATPTPQPATATPTPSLTPTATQPLPLIGSDISDKGIKMRRVPAGKFIASDGNETYLDAFDVDQYEVTNALYQACVDVKTCLPPQQIYSYTRPSYYGNPDFDNYPVIEVDWNMARNYCETWRGARLPAKAEWEKAARGPMPDSGSARVYSWGDGFDPGQANYGQNVGDTIPVGSYPRGRSAYGLYNMAGNVWEWIADFHFSSYNPSAQGNPLGMEYLDTSSKVHFIKGGSWYNDTQTLRLDNQISPIIRSSYASLLIGFRCARSIPPALEENPPAEATSEPTAMPVTDGKGVQMRRVPAGEFIMGSDDGKDNERPTHKVYLNTFDIDQYEVTNARYKACVDEKACIVPQRSGSASQGSGKYYDNPNFDHYPVIYVTWEMAKMYCEWRGARLPSEAEWEKAARGTDGRTYPWGEGIDSTYANFDQDDTTPVGNYEKGKSIYDVYDMVGNVWEWVNDWYDSAYYQNSPSTNPLGADSGGIYQYHVLRGGSWYLPDFGIRSASRTAGTIDYFKVNIGFRCARSLP